MIRKNILRAISAVLILTLLMSGTSCAERATDYDENQRLEIIKEDAEYTEAYISAAEARYTDIATSLIESYYGITLDVYQVSRVRAQFKLNIIPMLYRIKINEGELDGVLSSAEELIAENDGMPMPALLYEAAQDVLGADRAGRLLYGSALISLRAKAERAAERYLEYNLNQYKEESERCYRLTDELEAMGEDNFSAAISIFSTIGALVSGTLDAGIESAFLLGEGSVLYVLGYRIESFNQCNFTESDWATLGAMMSEFIPTKRVGMDVGSAMLYELKKSAYLDEAARAMPEVIALCSALISALREGGQALFAASADERALAMSEAILACRTELDTLDAALTEHAKTDDVGQRSVITKHLGEAALAGYSPIEKDALISGLEAITASGGIGAAEAERELIISYLYGIAPYLTVALAADAD